MNIKFRIQFKREVPNSNYSYTIQMYFEGTLKECIQWAEKEAEENKLSVTWTEEIEKIGEVKPLSPKDKMIV